MEDKLNVIEKRINTIAISLAVILILLLTSTTLYLGLSNIVLTVRNMQLEYQLELNKDELVNTRNELNGEKFFNQAQENGQWVESE